MDIKRLIKSLNAHKVRFVIIGATAGIVHGFTRLTQDIDVFVKPTRENIKRVLAALESCGYNISDITLREALNKKLLFRQYILDVDIHPKVTGIDFKTVWKNKVQCRFEGEKAYFASLEDLIKMKKAAGRPKDREDLRFLSELEKKQRGK